MINTLISQINYITFYTLAQPERKCYFYAKKKIKRRSAIYQVKNRKNYFVAQISIGKDRSGKRLRETITGSSKKEVFQIMQKALFLINTDSYSKEKIYFGEFFEIGFLTTFYSGLRLGEITALTWEDFQDNYLNINK